jgi:hypothetical protein
MTGLAHSAARLLACAAVLGLAAPALAAVTVLTAAPAGTAGGSATFRVEADADLGDFCYVLKFKGLGTIKDAAILPAEAEGDAKPLVLIEVTGADTDMCMAVEPDVLKPIVADPAKYQLVLRSSAAPKGVARGPLGK